jgi:hypothetical protein
MSSTKAKEQGKAVQQNAEIKSDGGLPDKSLDKVSGGINPQPLPPEHISKAIRAR